MCAPLDAFPSKLSLTFTFIFILQISETISMVSLLLIGFIRVPVKTNLIYTHKMVNVLQKLDLVKN